MTCLQVVDLNGRAPNDINQSQVKLLGRHNDATWIKPPRDLWPEVVSLESSEAPLPGHVKPPVMQLQQGTHSGPPNRAPLQAVGQTASVFTLGERRHEEISTDPVLRTLL